MSWPRCFEKAPSYRQVSICMSTQEATIKGSSRRPSASRISTVESSQRLVSQLTVLKSPRENLGAVWPHVPAVWDPQHFSVSASLWGLGHWSPWNSFCPLREDSGELSAWHIVRSPPCPKDTCPTFPFSSWVLTNSLKALPCLASICLLCSTEAAYSPVSEVQAPLTLRTRASGDHLFSALLRMCSHEHC